MARRSTSRSSIHYHCESPPTGHEWHYDVVLSRRRTLAIVVRRDGQVTVRAPHGTSAAFIQDWVQHKADWVKRKRRELAQRFPSPPVLRYTTGETHYYLGRPYRLALRPGSRGYGQLLEDAIVLPCPDAQPTTVHNRLTRWYRQQAHEVFEHRLSACWPAFAARGHQRPSLHIRQMKTLWGSLARKSKMTLNLSLIRAPEALIDYVIVHELCHLEHHNHGPHFQALMNQMRPAWRQQQQALEGWLY